MKFFTFPALLAAALFSAVVVIPFLPLTRNTEGVFSVEARLASSTAGNVQIYYDTGSGLREYDSVRLSLAASETPRLYRLSLPQGRYSFLRFDPIDRPGTVIVQSLRVVAQSGRVVRTIALSELRAIHEVASLQMREGGLAVVGESGKNDPQLWVDFAPPLEVRATRGELTAGFFPHALGVFVALAAALFALDRLPRLRHGVAALAGRVAAKPGRAITIVAAIAVIASAYPVIFLGKSYVSPNFGTSLLYDGFPTLPGSKDNVFVNNRGSDVGAIMWAHVPYSFVQHRALLAGELPLWNRYNSAGSPLLGQGQSMFGDPLHFLVVLANGAAWAWDVKFLVAKGLFAIALGLIVFAITRHLGAALLVSIAAPFIGFFVYRINHPAFFSMCYAPWVLYCWVRVTQAATARASALWAAGLIVANAALMNSGTAKEAYMLLLTLNFSGACVLLFSAAPWRERLAKFAGLAWAGVLFALLTAPIWATFLHTLANAQTAYDAASAYQIQPSQLLGLFDEAFYRPLSEGNYVFNPSLNFLLLLGLLYFLATLRLQFANRIALALAITSLVPFGFAFGLVPPQWIMAVPFLSNVAHIDNTFSCATIILWSILAGVGFAAAAQRLRSPEGRHDLVVAAVLLFGLVFAWIGFRQSAHRILFGAVRTFFTLRPGQVIPVDPFIWAYLVALLAAVLGLAAVVRRAFVRGALTAAVGVLVGLCAIVMLWRQGLQASAVGFEDYVVRPPSRVDFHAQSEAVTLLQSTQKATPSRGYGLHGNFYPGWTSAYALETINSPDAVTNRWMNELIAAWGIQRPWGWDLTVAPEDLPATKPFFDALNVRYYLDLHSDQGLMGRALKLVQTADLDVYESPTVWPRAFFTNRLEIYDETGGFVNALRTGDGQPFAAAQRSQLTEDRALLGLPRGLIGRTIAAATNYRLTENTTSFDVHADGPGVVVLNETFWPGDFRAEVNGKKAAVLRMNHAFRAVLLDTAGDYHVTFRCVPKNFPRNLLLCGVGAALLLGSLGLACRGRAGLSPPLRT